METIKKFLASALLTGLLLGAAAPVFAAVETGPTEQTTNVASAIAATYEVTIPASLAIDIKDKDDVAGTASDDVVLNQLDAAGSITVNAVASDLTLTGGTALVNETLDTTLTNGGTTAKSIDFSLTNTAATQTVKVGTAELGKDNKPGAYTGSIVFSFDYLEADAL